MTKKNATLRKTFLSALFVASAAFATAAAAADLTQSMQLLCNPNASYWSSSQARGMTSLVPYKGRLYTSGGDWYANTGAAAIFSIDPETGAYASEFIAGTETINYFRVGGDGRLYVPGLDQREGHANVGALFRRDLDGTWKALMNVPYGNIQDLTSPAGEGFAMHTWDLACWKGKVFTAGYGIAVGPEGSNEKMAVATPYLQYSQRQYRLDNQYTGFTYRRFSSFLAFDDEIFCYPSQYFRVAEPERAGYELEEWRYNPSTGLFDCQTNRWDNLIPGAAAAATRSGRKYSSTYNGYYMMLWHSTSFKGRVLYLAGVENTSATTWALYTAVNDNHHVKATQVDLGEGTVPFCVEKHVTRHGDEILAVVAAEQDADSGRTVNSVWESLDGVTFSKVLTFSANQQASALAYCGDSYYVGMGWRECCPTSWSFSGDDVVGNIYRIKYVPVYRPLELSNAIAVVKDNGASARLSVTVTCIEAPGASLSLSMNGEVVTNWTDVAEGETYFATVETVKGRAYDFAFTGSPQGYADVVSSGAFAASAVDGWFKVDFDDAGYKAGTGWTDLSLVSNPGGTWSDASGTSILVDATVHAPRHVEMDGNQEIVYTPTAPSDAGADVVVTGRVAVVASKLADAKTEDGLIASLFFADVAGEIVPHGFADGAWHALSRGTGLQSGQWVDYAVEIDLNSSAAPRVQYRVDGEALADGSGAAWLPLGAAPERVSAVAFRGMGRIGSFSGDTRAKIVTKYPIPVIGGGGESGGAAGGGLAFGADDATGSRTFSATVTNPVAGAYYTAFTSTELDGTFRAECIVQAKDGDEVIPLGVDATAPSKFVVIVVSATPFNIGDPLPVDGD